MHELILTEKAANELLKLPIATADRISLKLSVTQEQPWRYFSKLKERPEFSLRVGAYRVLADINATAITVLHIEKRETVY